MFPGTGTGLPKETPPHTSPPVEIFCHSFNRKVTDRKIFGATFALRLYNVDVVDAGSRMSLYSVPKLYH